MFLVNLAVADILVLIICAPVSILQVCEMFAFQLKVSKILFCVVFLLHQFNIVQHYLFLSGCHKHLDIRDADVQDCHILSGTLQSLENTSRETPYHINQKEIKTKLYESFENFSNFKEKLVYFQTVSMSVSVLTLTAIAYDRFKGSMWWMFGNIET